MNQCLTRFLPVTMGGVLLLLAGCGGGGTNGGVAPSNSDNASAISNGAANTADNNNPANSSNNETVSVTGKNPPPAPTLNIDGNAKRLHFSWNAADTATYYKLSTNADGQSGFTQVGANLTVTAYDLDIAVHRLNWNGLRYLVEACNPNGCSASSAVSALPAMLKTIISFQADNATANFGSSVALSRDGNTLAVGGRDASTAGAVYIFIRQGQAWTQQTYVKASNAAMNDSFGSAISLSSDGNTLAVGSYLEDSLGTGINGSQGSIAENTSNRGAAYVFIRRNSAWSQQAYIKSDGGHDNAYFGRALCLNGDGNTLAIGAIGERTGGMDAGAVYVFTRNGEAWSQQAFVKPSNILPGAHFGSALTLDGDGNTLAVGTPDEYNGAPTGGAVYVFLRGANTWSQQTLLRASNSAAFDGFGHALVLSGDGNNLAVGAIAEKSAAIGVDGNQADNSASGAGAVYVFTRATNWSQQTYLKASNTEANDAFGYALAFNSDGSLLAVSAQREASAANGIGGNQSDNSASGAGAVYVFAHDGGAWTQKNYVKALNTATNDLFGLGLGLSGDGNSLAIGANGKQAVYLY